MTHSLIDWKEIGDGAIGVYRPLCPAKPIEFESVRLGVCGACLALPAQKLTSADPLRRAVPWRCGFVSRNNPAGAFPWSGLADLFRWRSFQPHSLHLCALLTRNFRPQSPPKINRGVRERRIW